MNRTNENPKEIMKAYELLINNCRKHHETCRGCPLMIEDPKPYQPSGIPRYHCAAFPGNNTPPAFWPELDPGNIAGGQILDIDLEPQKIAIAMMRAGMKYPEGARAFFKWIDTFCQEAEKS